MSVIVIKPAPEHILVVRKETNAIVVQASSRQSVLVVGGRRGIPGPEGPQGPQGMPEIFYGTGDPPDPTGLHNKALFYKV